MTSTRGFPAEITGDGYMVKRSAAGSCRRRTRGARGHVAQPAVLISVWAGPEGREVDRSTRA